MTIKQRLSKQRPAEDGGGDEGEAVFIHKFSQSFSPLCFNSSSDSSGVNLHSSLLSDPLSRSTPIGTSSARLSGDALVGGVQLHLASPLAHGLDDGELAGALDNGVTRSGLGGGAEGGAGEDGGDHFDCDVTRKKLSEVVWFWW